MTEVQEVYLGVQELIDKLKNQGILEGQKQADAIIREAETKASDILLKAQQEADKVFAETRKKLQIEQKASHEAIKTAFRDSEIALRVKLREAFSAHLKKLVSLELRDKDFIKQLVLAIAGAKAAEIQSTPQMAILLPAEQEDAEAKAKLQHLVLGITNEMLREGVELLPSPDIQGGIKVRLVGQDLEIDLTDETLSNLLLKYLLPRYRDILSGQD